MATIAVQPQPIFAPRPQPMFAQPQCMWSPQVIAVQPQCSQSQYPYETKLSLSINLYIFKGEHDSQLKWPFKEKITITTIQGNNKNHPSVEKIFEGNRNHTSNGIKLDIKSLPINTPFTTPFTTSTRPGRVSYANL